MKTVFKATGARKEPLKEQTLHFEEGQFIYRQGDLGTEMYIVLEGEVSIEKEIRGERVVLSTLEKGDFFGEMAVIESAARSADSIALGAVTLLPINAARFDEMLRRNPEIALRMIRKYARRLEQANALLDRFAAAKVDPEQMSRPQSPEAADERRGVDAPRIHRLVHGESGRVFLFGAGEETTIGRSDPVTGILPDIDLTPVDNDRSVSRRHAKILRRDGRFLVLEEVGTINGTYVNNERIPTGKPVPLASGDELRVGLIEMRVLFES